MSAGISRHINGTINASWSGIFLPVPAFRQVSWLTDHHTKPPSQIFQNSPVRLLRFFSDRAFAYGFVFPAHSDEIAQVFHLFPFYLLSAPFRAAAAPDASSIVMGDILASSGLLCKDHWDVFINIHYDKQFLPVFSRSLSHPEGAYSYVHFPLSGSTRNPDSGTDFHRRMVPTPGYGCGHEEECPLAASAEVRLS